MQSLTIFTKVSGWYRNYAPLFKFCAEASYPEATVIVQEQVEPYDPPKYAAACSRLLEEPKTDTPYVYVTDVDMMLHPGLFEAHTEWMRENSMCYSNSPRGAGEPRGYERMTGLHFCSREWYRSTEDRRQFYERELFAGRIGNSRFDDELMLMNICRESFVGLPRAVRYPLPYWHFGIHMGTLRCYENHTRQSKNTQLSLRIDKQRASWWLSVCEQREFKKILTAIHDQRIQEQYRFLEGFCRRRMSEQ